MRLAATWSGVVALGLTACTLLYGPSDADFAGGTPDAGHLADGATSTSSTSSGGEAGTPPGDAGGGADAAGALTCAAGALLCDDFESSAVDPFLGTDGPIQTVTGGDSSGHALAATLTQGQDAPDVTATFSPTTATATFGFWFKLDSAAPIAGEKFRLASVLWGNGCDWQLSSTLTLTTDGLFSDISTYDQATNPACGPVDYGDQDPPLASSAVNDGNWHHITLVTDARTPHVTSVLTVDEEPPVALALDLTRSDLPTTVGIAIGVPCVQTTGGCFDYQGPPWRVLYDDVSFTSP